LPEILRRRPNAHAVIVGGDGVSYGSPAPPGTTYRQALLQEVGTDLDLTRVHFLGQVPYSSYINLLQISSAHVYLTYPFVLSWSFIESLACGCVVIGSATPPVLEVLDDGVNGFAVDFFEVDALTDRIEVALKYPKRMAGIRQAARATAVGRYDLKRMLGRWEGLIDDLLNGRRPELDLS
jgi:glycosyltransferase involved in cell wall biosynthesis